MPLSEKVNFQGKKKADFKVGLPAEVDDYVALDIVEMTSWEQTTIATSCSTNFSNYRIPTHAFFISFIMV